MKLVVGIFFILTAFVAGYKVGGIKIENKHMEKTYTLEYGDDFSELELQSYDGKKCKLNKSDEQYHMIFYMDTKCSTCIKELTAIEHLNNIFCGDDVEVKIIWSGGFEVENIQKYGINQADNFYIQDGKISAATPSCYILDKDNKIIFITEEVDKAVKKVLTLDGIHKNQIVERCNYYLKSLAQKDKRKPVMICFLMKGCKDCENAKPVLESASLKDEYDIINIYDADAYGGEAEVDVGNVYLEIYGIDWYPSILLIKDREYVLIRETPIEELKEKIQNAF